MLKLTVLLLLLATTQAFASDKCDLDAYVKSPEGQEKLVQMLERSKSLILSKLEEIGVEEKDVTIRALLPKSIDQKGQKNLFVELNHKQTRFRVWGEGIVLTKISLKQKESAETPADDVCGLEIKFLGGKLMNKENGRELGSLGRVKEFIRLN
jgi:hypothetical protein